MYDLREKQFEQIDCDHPTQIEYYFFKYRHLLYSIVLEFTYKTSN